MSVSLKEFEAFSLKCLKSFLRHSESMKSTNEHESINDWQDNLELFIEENFTMLACLPDGWLFVSEREFIHEKSGCFVLRFDQGWNCRNLYGDTICDSQYYDSILSAIEAIEGRLK